MCIQGKHGALFDASKILTVHGRACSEWDRSTLRRMTSVSCDSDVINFLFGQLLLLSLLFLSSNFFFIGEHEQPSFTSLFSPAKSEIEQWAARISGVDKLLGEIHDSLNVGDSAPSSTERLSTYEKLTPVLRKRILLYFSLLNINKEILVFDNPTDFMSDLEERSFFNELKSLVAPSQVILILSSKLFSNIFSDSTFELTGSGLFPITINEDEDSKYLVSQEIRADIRSADPYNSDARMIQSSPTLVQSPFKSSSSSMSFGL